MVEKHKEKTVPRILLFICTLIGIIFSVYLVVNEISTPGFCPEIFNVPACYLVIVSFILVFISLFTNRALVRITIFYIGAISGLMIAIWFSIGQIIGIRECPDLFNIPLCFVLSVLFVIIIVSGSIEVSKHFLNKGE